MPQPTPAAFADSLRVSDSLRTAADSLQGKTDSLAAAVDSLRDTTNAVQAAARDIGDASELLVQGRWDQFAAKVLETVSRMLLDFIPDLIKALVVFFLLFGLYKLARAVLQRIVRSSDRMDEGLKNLILRSFRIVGVLLIFVMVLAQFGIDITVLVGGLSIAGLAIGFAAKDTLENFISGVAIMLDRPFRVGDQVDVGGTYGTVVDISLRSTRLRTLNNEIMVMPNLQMINQKLINHAMLGAVRVAVPFSVAYQESPDAARRVLLPLAEQDDRIAQDPPPHVVVVKLNDSGVDMELRFFLPDPARETPMRSEYLETVHHALRQAGIEIPFPQLDVFLKPTDDAAVAVDVPSSPETHDDRGDAAAPFVVVEGAKPREEAVQLEQKLEEEGVDPHTGNEEG